MPWTMVLFNMDYLETVCRDCHAKIHGKYVQERYKVDEVGRVIISPHQF